MRPLRLTACDFMVYKDHKYQLKIFLSNIWSQLQDPTPHLFSYRLLCPHPSQHFFEVPLMRVFSLYLPSAFDHTHGDQLSAAFEVHSDTSYRQEHLSQK